MSKGSGNAHKLRRSSNNRRLKIYRKFFINCVKRTGKWRGKKKTMADLVT